MDNDIDNMDSQISETTNETSKKPKKTIKKKKVTKKTSKKATKKTTKKVVSKSTKSVKKTTKKKTTKKKVAKENINPLHSIAEKTFKVFDSIIDEVREIPKKTSEFSKHNQFIDSFTNLLTKTKEEFIVKKNEFSELHNLNMSVSSNKRTLVELYLKLGKKTIELIDKKKIEAEDLKHLYEQINNIQNDIKQKETQIKKIISKK